MSSLSVSVNRPLQKPFGFWIRTLWTRSVHSMLWWFRYSSRKWTLCSTCSFVGRQVRYLLLGPIHTKRKQKNTIRFRFPLMWMGLWSGISVLRPPWNNRHRKLENFLSLELINTNSVAMAFNRSKGLFTHNVCVSVNIQLQCSAYSDTYTNVENGWTAILWLYVATDVMLKFNTNTKALFKRSDF